MKSRELLFSCYLTIVGVLLCNCQNPVLYDSTNTYGVGADTLSISGGYTDILHNISAVLVGDIPLGKAIVGSASCTSTNCDYTITCLPLPAEMLGKVISVQITTINGTSNVATVGVVVPPPVITASEQNFGAWGSVLTITGTSFGQNCTGVKFQPYSITGVVSAYTADNSMLVLRVDSVTDVYIGSNLNASVRCNGAWSPYTPVAHVIFPPVDATSAIICSGTSSPISMYGQASTTCIVSVRGNNHAQDGNSSLFTVELPTTAGSFDSFVQTTNKSWTFTYHTPTTIADEVTVTMNVLLASTQEEIIGSPIQFKLWKTDKEEFWTTNKKIMASIIAAVVVAGIAGLVIFFVRKSRRNKYTSL